MIEQSILQNFFDHRKDIKKPMSDRAKSMLVRKLERAEKEGHDIELLIENAIIGGWQTVYPNETTKRKLGFIERHQQTGWADNVRGIK